MKLSIIIVNYNTKELLDKCIFSIYRSFVDLEEHFLYEIIVVDNASTDGSVSQLKRKFPKVTIIENKKNVGFGQANNQGIEKAKGEYVLLLNSDTLVEKHALQTLVKRAQTDEKIGVLGPKLLNKNKSLQPSAGFFPSLMKVVFWMLFLDDLPIIKKHFKSYHVEEKRFYKKEQYVDWISGACMLIRKKVLAKSGLFEKDIFMYGEEVDLCFRIKKSGFRICYYPKAEITHYKGSSGEGIVAGLIEEFDFLKYFYQKYKPFWQEVILSIMLFVGSLLRFLLFGIILRQRKRALTYAKYLKVVR